MLSCLGVCIEENVNVVSLDSASPVLGRIDDAVNHDLRAVRDDPWVYCDGVSGRGNGAGTCMASPAFGTGAAGAVSGSLKDPKGHQSCAPAALPAWASPLPLVYVLGLGKSLPPTDPSTRYMPSG